MVQLQRPWRRHRSPKHPGRIVIMAKLNCKVYADLGLDRDRMFRVLSILDTGAGLNFVRRTELPVEVERYIRHGPLPDICDASNKPATVVGTVNLPVKLGTFIVHVELSCDKALLLQ